MKVHFDIQDDIVKGLDIRLTPIEGLILNSALLQFTHELSNNETDRITAMRMCDAYIEAMEGADDYERAIEQMEHDMLYEPTYNSEDGSM